MRIFNLNLTDKKIATIVLSAMCAYLLVVLFLSEGTFDYGDGLTHYFISHYSWKHPYLFIDDWGKPLFTILSSPFAQFGLKGIALFNIGCGLSAAYIAYRIAERLNIPSPYLAIIFTCSAPIYLSVMNSGLTEPLFSAMLMLCIWLLIDQRYYISAVIFSFLPFVRAEFAFVLPVFCIYYIIKRKYLPILLLPLGSILFSIIGSFYYKNIFWLITKNPYSFSHSKAFADAAKGSIFSYIRQYHNITGTALTILIILGFLWLLYRLYLGQKEKDKLPASNLLVAEIILIYGSFFSILIVHSLVWGLDIFPTLGLARYMSTLIPFAAIIALRGLGLLVMPFPWRLIKVFIVGIFIFKSVVSPYKLWYSIPFKPGETEAVINNATQWLKQSKYAANKVYYMDPYISVGLNIDPYDFDRRGELWGIDSVNPQKDMPKGGILIWDAHYGPEEGKMQLYGLLNNTHLKILNVFKPEHNFKVIGNRDYAVYIFAADSAKKD